MNTSSRFIVATHVMTALAAFKLASGKLQTFKSDFISDSVNTNPVVIRLILGMLRKAGLVQSQTGRDGGSKLACDPEKISLLEIYNAVEEGQLFHLHYSEPNQECPIGYNIQDACAEFFQMRKAPSRRFCQKRTSPKLPVRLWINREFRKSWRGANRGAVDPRFCLPGRQAGRKNPDARQHSNA